MLHLSKCQFLIACAECFVSPSVLTQLPFEAGGIAYMEQSPFAFPQRCCLKPSRALGINYFFLPHPRAVESKKKAVQRIEEQLMKLEVQATDREENKQIALSTSKLNYLDPRISVAW